MLSLSENDNIIKEGERHGVSPERTLELINLFRRTYRSDPGDFSMLLEVLE
ncbi:MAG: hypothetical protein J9259_10035 [Thermoplasmata archaeon YP2-bin.285]|uniref:Uncharacterized protein n=1 Tax=Candidatus Sysuiplasma superficiale TaxID=2823368 RepID=A0A8J7YR62_9ARCH|nr:hypothetical protein [Candidatus Sysuiplasma superficiale]